MELTSEFILLALLSALITSWSVWIIYLAARLSGEYEQEKDAKEEENKG